jgi:Phytanoyl-CoA dioxygenase (PhyH)
VQWKQKYRADGYFSPLDALSAPETARALAGYQQIATRLGGAPKPTQLFLLHLYHRWAWDLVTHPGVVDAVERVLGPNILVWDSSVFPKPSHSMGFVSMHQDGTYWGLEQGEVVTAWVALTDSTRANGCMRVVPGSHQLPIQPHEDTHATDNLLTRGQRVRTASTTDTAVDIELRAGQMSLHHVRLIHGSHANSSDQHRIGYAVRYVTPAVIPARQENPALAVRGRDTAGHWDIRSGPPDYASFDEAHGAQQEAARRHLEELT